MFAVHHFPLLLSLSFLICTPLIAADSATLTISKQDEAIKAIESPNSPKIKTKPDATPGEVAQKIAERLKALQAAKAHGKNVPPRLSAKIARVAPTVPIQVRVSPPKTSNQWAYIGENGPLKWAAVNPEWIKCGNGQRQSPIDIRSGIKVDLESIVFNYKPSAFTIVDNGHTIQTSLAPGNRITVQGRSYELIQFHFHRPSEERINGRAYDMVAHLLHRDDSGKLAMVAVLIERGAATNLIQTVWNNIPLEKNELVSPSGTMDMNDILPLKRDYFTYMGSLTTPPCSEGVLWMVMKNPVTISQEQIDIFAHLYSMNARPIQPTAERLIKESN